MQHLYRKNVEAILLGSFAFGMTEGMSSDAENDFPCSDEEPEHNVDNLMLRSFAHHL